jgi:hypothetical protein
MAEDDNLGKYRRPKPEADVTPTPTRAGVLSRGGGAPFVSNPLGRSTTAPIAPAVPAPNQDAAAMYQGGQPQPAGATPMRSAMAPAPASPQPSVPGQLGIAPYVAQARQMATGMNPAVMNQNTPSMNPNPQGAPPFSSQATNLFASGPLNRGPQPNNPNPLIGDRDRATAASNLRGAAVDNLQSGRDASVAGMMRGGATEEQALAMGAQRGTPQVTDAMRRGNALMYGGENITPRAQAQGMFGEPMDPAEAQKKLNDGKPAASKEQTAKAKARGAANYAKFKEADAFRRSNDPLTLMNIARAQERPAQLAEKRAVAEQKGAANRMMAQAMGQRDPRVKAQMAGQAGEMAREVGARPPMQRTTYGDILNKQREQDIQMVEAQARGQGQAPTPGQQARIDNLETDTAKKKAELDAMKSRMPEHTRIKYEALLRERGGLIGSERRTAIDAEIAGIEQSVPAAQGGGDGGGRMDVKSPKPQQLPYKNGVIDVNSMQDGQVYTNSRGESGRYNAKTKTIEFLK